MDKMTKERAILLFKKNYNMMNLSNTTYASKNKGVNKYWANPKIKLCKTEWYFILNDTLKRKLYLFIIPRGALQNKLCIRSDKNWLVDLQIQFNDVDFMDTRSKVCFGKFLSEEILY